MFSREISIPWNWEETEAGDSAGGNLAAVTAIRALQENGPKIASLLLFYPSVSGEHDFPSVDMFAGGYGLSLQYKPHQRSCLRTLSDSLNRFSNL